MSKIFATTVFLTDPDGQTVQFNEDDEAPSWIDKVEPPVSDYIWKKEVEEDEYVVDSSGRHPNSLDAAGAGDLNYEGMTHEQLDDLLEERGLIKSGNKQEKADRLVEYDATVA